VNQTCLADTFLYHCKHYHKKSIPFFRHCERQHSNPEHEMFIFKTLNFKPQTFNFNFDQIQLNNKDAGALLDCRTDTHDDGGMNTIAILRP
jgi:hypothetical protein